MLHKIILTVIVMYLGFLPIKADASLCPGAVSAILIETSSNSVIFEKNAHKKLPMASTTKIMTALCAIESGILDRNVEADPRAIGVEGSSIYLERGERLTVRELVYGLMLHSGNDAAVAIACAVSGSEEGFAQLMNETAKKIGAVNTNFENPNGLDGKEHYTTAYDLAIITSYALKNPEFAAIVSTYKTTISNGDKGFDRQLKNHNKLLTMYEGCTGVKTGFTKKSGRCLVSSAKRNNTELVAVTLNDGNDWNDHMQLLDYGFDNTETKCILKKGSYLRKIHVKNGAQDTVDAICDNDVYITNIKGNKQDSRIEYDITDRLTAPVEYGQSTGKINIISDGKIIASAQAVTAEAVSEKPKSRIAVNMGILMNFWLDMIR
ncbi:MAG: D-alanyl-D-alanine carboxypeptidase [Clostridia bacterium]|nr:D-alanyl-D-alanine carboxypeptidase [Clostridia bacterium]